MNCKDFLCFLREKMKPVMLRDDSQDLVYISDDGLLVINLDTKHVLKPCANKAGRPMIKLRTSDSWQDFYVSRIVADCYCNNNLGKPIAHHIDGNPMNNDYHNLLWCTSSEHKILHHLMDDGKIQEYKEMVAKILAENGGCVDG